MSLFPTRKIFLQLGPLTITMYAVCILTGAILAYLLAKRRFIKYGYDGEWLSDYFIYVMVIGILGARIWYVIFEWDLYKNDPTQIFMINNGGLAIQGGLLAALAFSVYKFKKDNISWLKAGDAIMPCVLVGQCLGRWGNFFNQEAHGGEVTKSFLESLHLPNFIIEGMHINGIYYHPTFLYESLGCIISFLIIYFIIHKLTKYHGIEFSCYFIFYGILRYFVEGLRTDSLYVMGLRTAQLISIGFIVFGLCFMLYSIKTKLEKK